MTAIRAAVYVRISQDRTGMGEGVERQKEDCTELAERLGWTVVDIYNDNDTSAYSGKPRRDYNRMLADVEMGRIEAIVAWHPDRLHRAPRELEDFIDFMEKRRVKVHTVRAGDYDFNTPTGRAVARTAGAWARQESEHKADRVRRALQQRAAEGAFHGGVRPFGFEKDGLTPREGEAAEIADAVNAVIAGVSLRSLVRDLNRRAVPTASGRGEWASSTLRDILTSPRIAGLTSSHGEIVAKAKWPAIVSEDAWRAAKAILEDPGRRKNQRGGTIRWLGSGIYVCGVCGRRELRVSTSGSKRRPAYRCRARDFVPDSGGHVVRTAETLDEYVETVIVERLKRADLGEYLVDKEHQATVAELRRERLALTERRTNLSALLIDGVIDRAQLEAGNARFNHRLAEIEQRLELLGRRSPLSLLAGAPDIEALWFGTKEDRSDGLSLGARRTILDDLVTVTVLRSPTGRARDGVYFDPSYVKIEWKATGTTSPN